MSQKSKPPPFLKDIWRRNIVAYLFLLPAIIMMLLFNAYPVVFSIGVGFTNMRLANIIGGYQFIGLDNYAKILTVYGPAIQSVLLITFLWTAVNVSLQVAVGLAFALLYNSKDLVGKRFHLAIVILPWAIPGLTSTMVWTTMFQTTFGSINQLLRTIGLVGYPGPNWLNNQWLAFSAYNIVNTWLAYPFMMTMILGALQGVSPELYEAAAIDGARSWSRLRHITLPSIRRPLLLATLLTTNTTFQQFNVPYLLNQGGPANTNQLVMVWAYQNIFVSNFYGLASAFLGIILVIILIIGFLGIRASRIAEEAK
jgi:arabinogalactan oligomer/maltooligosaccharide transport system permease protein